MRNAAARAAQMDTASVMDVTSGRSSIDEMIGDAQKIVQVV